MRHADALTALIATDATLMELLRTAGKLGMTDWCIGAGAVRNLVWNHLHPGRPALCAPDVDFVYFEPGDLSATHEAQVLLALTQAAPQVTWDVVNQARVHLWYENHYGVAKKPLDSLAAGIASWPETATCVGASLDTKDQLHIIAPHGLDDLFNLILRRNPAFTDKALYLQRLTDKRFSERWPGLQIAPDQ